MSTNRPRRQRRGESLERLHLALPADLHAAAKAEAARLGVTRAAWIVAVLARELDMPGHELPNPETT